MRSCIGYIAVFSVFIKILSVQCALNKRKIFKFQEVVFPSMTICNLNQVEASFLKENDAYGNMTKMNVLLNEFIKGRKGNLSKHDETYLNQMKDKLLMNLGWSFLDQSRQICRNLFMRVSFRGKHITWNQIEDFIMGPG